VCRAKGHETHGAIVSAAAVLQLRMTRASRFGASTPLSILLPLTRDLDHTREPPQHESPHHKVPNQCHCLACHPWRSGLVCLPPLRPYRPHAVWLTSTSLQNMAARTCVDARRGAQRCPGYLCAACSSCCGLSSSSPILCFMPCPSRPPGRFSSLVPYTVDATVLGATPHPIDRATAPANPHPAATINNRVPGFLS
jgi:hypothetical protein